MDKYSTVNFQRIMAPFYKELKSLREEQGIDLEEIHNRTKINLNSLEALESGQFDMLPTPYVRLFLKAYVIEIGADVDETLDKLEHHLNLLDGKTRVSKRNKSGKYANISTESNNRALPFNSSQSLQKKTIKALPIIICWSALIILLLNYKLTVEEKEQQSQFKILDTFLDTEKTLKNKYKQNLEKIELENLPPYELNIVSDHNVELLIKKDTLSEYSKKLFTEKFSITIEKNLNLILNNTFGVKIFLNKYSMDMIPESRNPFKIKITQDPPQLELTSYRPIL